MNTHLSPRELGRVLGVSESSLKRWIDEGRLAAARTAGGHRRVALAEAQRFIHASGLAVADPRVLAIAAATAGVATDDPAAAPTDALHTALVAGRLHEAHSLIVGLYLAGRSVADLCDGPIAQALAALHRQRQQGDRGIYRAHRALDLCLQALFEVRRLLATPPADAPFAVGGAPPGDPYLLPALAATTVLTAEGWHVTNLGAQTPLGALAEAAGDADAELVYLCVNTRPAAERMTDDLPTFADQLAELGAALVVVGPTFATAPPTAHRHLHLARSMSELAAFARGLRRAAGQV